jgi:hypothetical protein
VIQTYLGRSQYRSEVARPTGDLLVAVLCRVGDLPDMDIALLDTASQWCILPPAAAATLDCHLDSPGDTHLLTRFGRLSGDLIRLPTLLVADEGEELEIETTWFVCREWPGPMVLGWKGCLERIRFGFDPSAESFFFSDL